MKSKKSEIIFLVSSETSFGVLESQVFNVGNYISENYSVKVKFVLVGDMIKINEEKYSSTVEFHFLNKTVSINEIKSSIIYIRTFDIFLKNYLKLKLNGNILIYDFRALLFSESFNRNKSYIKSSFIFLLEMTCYLLANKICTVSNTLKNKLKFYFVIKREIFVFPCLVINNSKEFKNKASNNIINFVYVGGLSKWQKFSKIIDLYIDFVDKSRLKSTMTIITKNKMEAEEFIRKQKFKATVKSMTNAEVLIELSNYDFGFLIRDKNLLNKVSSPIKFLEYLSCGVIPIMTEGIGDYSEEAKKSDVAIVLNHKQTIPLAEIKRFKFDVLLNKRIEMFNNRYVFEERIKAHPLLETVKSINK